MRDRDQERWKRLTPEQRAAIASAMVNMRRPDIVAERTSARESLDREFAETGTIATIVVEIHTKADAIRAEAKGATSK